MSLTAERPPASHEMEVSLFGPGYGESAAVHVGNGHWIVVDSCLDSRTKRPASLSYLERIGVHAEEVVRALIITHWHDDHCRGAGELLAACSIAEFIISEAVRSDELLTLLSLHQMPIMAQTSGFDELLKTAKIMKHRKAEGRPNRVTVNALMDRLLYEKQIHLEFQTVTARVTALSPSDSAIERARLSFAKLIPRHSQPKLRIGAPRVNHCAVALWIEVGRHNVMLGSDLENDADADIGWRAVVNNSKFIRKRKADVFKVAHHGSATGHDDTIWEHHLCENPTCALTPFRQGRHELPTQHDMRRICNASSQSFITSYGRERAPKITNRIVQDMPARTTKSVRQAHGGWGHIRLRCNLSDHTDNWRVELFGDACPLRSVIQEIDA